MPLKFPASQFGKVVSADIAVANNTSGSLFTLDKTATKSAWFTYDIYRISDTDPEAFKSGLLVATHKTDSDEWVISDLIEDFDPGSLVGVVFTINPATGEIGYTSSNYDTNGYVSSLKIKQISELAQ